MPLRFTVLASGSAGNASLLEADDFGVLIDAGLGPRLLADRLGQVGASWHQVQAVLLTHIHSDHWNARTFAQLLRRRIPLYCHADHRAPLRDASPAFAELLSERLVRFYEADCELRLDERLRCRPLPLAHDGGPTFGFRFEGESDFFGERGALAYAADLGSWTADLTRALADVDLLALEFNHDEERERNSGRAPELIARVLGDQGHLSNGQAAELLRDVLRQSPPGRLRHVVQLHLSRDCNRASLARKAAHAVLGEWTAAVAIHTARQERPGPRLTLGAFPKVFRSARRRCEARRLPAIAGCQPLLPRW